MPDPSSNPGTAVPDGVPAKGDVFAGKYRIEGVLGVGGMGAVLAARHLALDEPVAVKVMLPQMAQDGAVSMRFLREARAAVKIRSEHVARVLDFGQTGDGQPYIVMEYLVGKDLGLLLSERGPLPVNVVTDYLLQACEAIAQAHALGIVHRDLKPGNLFLTHREDGSACIKVLDFGISKATAAPGAVESLTLTTTQSLVGSPMYMAPEQMRTTQPVDGRTDIWSIGVVAYELLTGTLPFDARAMPELCAMILQDDPLPPRSRRPDLPADVEAVILRCLEKKPDRRFSDLSAFAWALAPHGSPSANAAALRVSRALKARLDEASPSNVGAPSSSSTPRTAVLAPTVAIAHTEASWTGAQLSPVPRHRWAPLARGLGAATLATSLLGVGAWSWLRPARPGDAPAAATSSRSAAEASPTVEPSARPPSPAYSSPLVELAPASAPTSAAAASTSATDAGAPSSKTPGTRAGPNVPRHAPPPPTASSQPRPSADPGERMKSRFD